LSDGSFHDVKLVETQNQTSQFEISVRPPVPGAIEGTLREAGSGKPVANVRVYLNHWSVTQPHLDVVSDEQGAFRFEGLAPMDVHTVVVNDSRWRGRSESLTVKPGETTRGVVIETHPAPHARGRVAITGKPPGDTLVFGIGDFDSLGWVEHAGSLGVGVCDASGNIDIVPRYPRRVGVVPKRRTTPELGGYRKFASEFPRVTVKPWPWTIDAPDSGIVALDVDLPADFERR
jgi:hypothetical protein